MFSSGTTQATTVPDEVWIGGVSNHYETLPGSPWNNFTNRPYCAAGFQITSEYGRAVYSGTQFKGSYSAAAVVALAGPEQ